MNKRNLLTGILFFILIFSGCASTSKKYTPEELATIEQDCQIKEQESSNKTFIYAAGECIEYYYNGSGESEEINLIIHGSWNPGSNPVRSKYKGWANFLSTHHGIDTIALSMPGYAGSSSNQFKSLKWKGCRAPYATEEYLAFVSELVSNLKQRYKAIKVNGIGQSAGANIFSTLAGYQPSSLNKVVMFAGEAYIDSWCRKKGSRGGNISAVDYLDDIIDTKFLIVAGSEDRFDRLNSAYRFKDDLAERGIEARVIPMEGVGHNVDNDSSVWNEAGIFLSE